MLEKSINVEIKFLVATGIGLLFGWFQLRFWALYPVNNPITNWLLDTFAKDGHSGLYRLFSYMHDFVVHFMLAMILAIVLVRIFGRRQWPPITVVVITYHVALFWNSVWVNMGAVVQYPAFWISLAISTSALPIAYLTAGRLRQTPTTS